MTVVRWITGCIVVATMVVFCIMGARIDREITKQLKSARKCYTPGEAVCYLREAQNQLTRRDWKEEADQVGGLISQLNPSSSYSVRSIDLRFADVKAKLWETTEWEGENFPMPPMSHFELIDKYRYGSFMWFVWWASLILFIFSFREKPEEEIVKPQPSLPREFGHYIGK